MKVGDLVRLRHGRNVVGLVQSVRDFPHRASNVYVRWHTMHQSHGDRWFDEGDLELLVISTPIAYSADPM